MPINVLMPALSPTMEEGTLARWLVREGDRVSSGTLIAEIETDKATMEFEAVDEGTIGKIVVREGTEGVRVNDVIAVILEDGERSDDLTSQSVRPEPQAVPNGAASVVKNGLTQVEEAATPQQTDDTRIFASPLARRIADDRGIDLTNLKGSGPNGRIVKSDVEGTPAARSTITSEAPREPRATTTEDGVRRVYADREYEEVLLDPMRRSIAARLTEAKRTIPHFYLRRDVCIDGLLALRADLNASLDARGIRLSVNDFVIKATAMSLQQVPDCNAVWAGDRIFRLNASDVAVAVAVDGGLYTPVLRDAEAKTLSAISREMKDLAARARDRMLAPAEYAGGSISVSNLGMFGVESFDAIINPPQAAILAIGAGSTKPVARDNRVETATMMSVTMSVDHRIIDGGLGATFLAHLTDNLERPIAMLA